MNGTRLSTGKKMLQLPDWICPNSNALSPLYKRIWEAVQDNHSKAQRMYNEVLVDTNKIFPLLLTSQLPTEVLGYIWSLANQKYAGQLTEQELYVVLALVALAQASYPFNSLEVLCYIHSPPNPNLNLTVLETDTGKNEIKLHVCPFESSSVKNCDPNKKFVNVAKLDSKPTCDLSSDTNILSYNYIPSNNFKDVKSNSVNSSLNANSTYLEDTREHFSNRTDDKCNPTDLSDDFSDFQSAPMNAPNIPIVLDSKQGSAIGSRLANHNLGVKKFNDKVKRNSVSRNSNNNQIRNVTTHNSTSYNKELQSSEQASQIFHKCTLRSQAKTVILKDTAIRCSSAESNPNNFKNSTENVGISKNSVLPTIEPFCNTSLKKEKKDSAQQDLMSLQPNEDKYSALRVLNSESLSLPNDKLNTEPNVCLATDDYGEFVSAENIESAAGFEENNSTDLLSDLDLSLENTIERNRQTSPLFIQDISDSFNALVFDEIADQHTKEKFDVVLNTEKILQNQDDLSVNNVEVDPAITKNLAQSRFVRSLHPKSLLPSSQENKQQFEHMLQMICWEWKHYMKRCILLLQVSANVFTSITSEIVLKEVLLSSQGYNFLCNLAEVAVVCRRINFSQKELEIHIMGFDELLMEIDRIWSEMESFYSNIPIVSELPAWPLQQGDGISCALCLTLINSGRVTFNNNNYHATCANLWLHIVNNNLPALQYPMLQSTII